MKRVFTGWTTGNLFAALVAIIALGSLAGCDSDANDIKDSQLDGGILATFDVSGTEYRIWITNETTIDQVLALQAGTSDANIPNGEILRGPGRTDHNDPWSWHISPENIEMAELTIELCDGNPTFVEENVDYFVNTVGNYCPWSAELVDVEDFR